MGEDEEFRTWKLKMLKFFDTHKPKMGVSMTIVCECPNCGSKITIDGKARPKLTYHNVTKPGGGE